MLILKQSTAIDIRLGPFVDSTDGVTPETGVTLGAADQAEVLKANGAATATMAGTFAAVTGSDGWYDYTVATGDVDTVGEVVFVVQDSSVCLPVFTRGYVVEEAVYDALYAASAGGPLQSTVAGRTLDVTATGAAGIDWGNVENPTTAVDLSGTDIQLCDTITTYTGNTLQTGDSFARLGAPAGASVSADIGTAQADLDTITGSDGVTLATSQGAITYGAVTISVTGATDNITFAGSGSGDVLAFTRSGSGNLMDTGYSADFQAEVNTASDLAISDAALATAANLATVDANVDTMVAGILTGTASGTPTTTTMDTDLTGYADDELISRVVVFTGGTANGQVARITDYANTSGVVTMTTLTTAPVSGDTFKIV